LRESPPESRSHDANPLGGIRAFPQRTYTFPH
jgi:hypothetical protein